LYSSISILYSALSINRSKWLQCANQSTSPSPGLSKKIGRGTTYHTCEVRGLFRSFAARNFRSGSVLLRTTAPRAEAETHTCSSSRAAPRPTPQGPGRGGRGAEGGGGGAGRGPGAAGVSPRCPPGGDRGSFGTPLGRRTQGAQHRDTERARWLMETSTKK
jgi:hypothetical protein